MKCCFSSDWMLASGIWSSVLSNVQLALKKKIKDSVFNFTVEPLEKHQCVYFTAF